MDIIGLVKDQLDDRFMDAAAGVTGLGPDQTRKAVGATIPAVLASVLGSASTRGGKSALDSLLRDQDPGMLGNLSSMLTGNGQQSLIGSGVQSMTSLLGEGKLTGLVRELSRFAGIGQGAGKSLLGMVAPAVMGVLGREQRASGRGVDGILDMLKSQRSSIASAMPASLATALKPMGLLDGISDDARQATDTRYATEEPRRATVQETAQPPRRPTHTRERPQSRNWGIIAGVLAAIAVLAWALTRDRTPDTAPPRQATTTERAPAPAAERPPAPAETPAPAAPAAGTSALMVGNVDVGREFNAITDRFSATVRDVRDGTSAEAALPQLDQLNEDIDALAPLLDRLPDSARPTFVDMAEERIAALQPEIERIRSMDSVPDTVKETVETLGGKLEDLLA